MSALDWPIYPADGRTSAQLLVAADAAMYDVKRSGGRQVQRSEGEPAPIDFDQPIWPARRPGLESERRRCRQRRRPHVGLSPVQLALRSSANPSSTSKR